MDVDLQPEDYRDWNDPRYPDFSPWKFIKAAVGLQLAGTYALSKLSNSDYMSGPFTENIRKRKSDRISEQTDGGVLAQIEKPPTGPSYKKRNKGTQTDFFQPGRKIYFLRPSSYRRFSRRRRYRRRKFFRRNNRRRFRRRRYRRRY